MKQKTIIINDITHDIESIEQHIWKNLVNGAVKPKDGLRSMTIGTVDDNGLPFMRTVVLRKTDEATKTLFFYTDARSRKVAHFADNQRITILFYDPHRRLQLFAVATVIVHHGDEVARLRWSQTNAKSRLTYMSVDAPNSFADYPTVGHDEKYLEQEPTTAESDAFEFHFMVIECRVSSMECLILQRTGNRKAIFHYENGACKEKNWLVP